jgi:GNAT superfamily N-acetyltransferase
MGDLRIRPVEPGDSAWVSDLVQEQWGAPLVVSRGVPYHVHRLPGFVALQGQDRVGLVTYHVKDQQCETVTLNSLRPGQGIGTALIEAVVSTARRAGCWRVWLITTNDNLQALRFYQKRGFVLAVVHPNALERSRRIKPQIPYVGADGIPLRDEIELEMVLDRDKQAVPDLWWKWLWVVSWAGCAGGVVLALGAPLFAGAMRTLYAFIFGGDAAQSLSAAEQVTINVALGIGGGLQAGSSAIIALMARHPIRRGERWAWVACVLGLGLWLALDTGLTTWYVLNGYPRLWPKLVNDLCFVGMFGIPYAALYRYCKR